MVDAITAAGGKAIAVQGNVSKQEDISRIFAEMQKAFGRLDVLVNNAGIYEFAPLGEITEGGGGGGGGRGGGSTRRFGGGGKQYEADVRMCWGHC